MVRKERLELSRLAALEPKSSASTNSATLAFSYEQKIKPLPNSVKRVLYLNFAKFDKQKPQQKHKNKYSLPSYDWQACLMDSKIPPNTKLNNSL